MTILNDSEEEFIERGKPLIKKHQEMCKRVGSEPEEGSYVLSEKSNIYHGVPFECAGGVHGEENAIGTMLTEEGKNARFKMILIVGGRDTIVMPCGACRVAIYMYGVQNATVLCSDLSLTEIKKFTISELYPYPYEGEF